MAGGLGALGNHFGGKYLQNKANKQELIRRWEERQKNIKELQNKWSMDNATAGGDTPVRDFLSKYLPSDDHFTWPGPGKDLLLNTVSIEFALFAIPFSAPLSAGNIVNYATIGIASHDLFFNPKNIPNSVRIGVNAAGVVWGRKGTLQGYESIFNNSIKAANGAGAGLSSYTLYDLIFK